MGGTSSEPGSPEGSQVGNASIADAGMTHVLSGGQMAKAAEDAVNQSMVNQIAAAAAPFIVCNGNSCVGLFQMGDYSVDSSGAPHYGSYGFVQVTGIGVNTVASHALPVELKTPVEEAQDQELDARYNVIGQIDQQLRGIEESLMELDDNEAQAAPFDETNHLGKKRGSLEAMKGSLLIARAMQVGTINDIRRQRGLAPNDAIGTRAVGTTPDDYGNRYGDYFGAGNAATVDTAGSIIPVASDLRDIQEAATGYDVVNQRRLTPGERAITTGMILVPIIGAAAFRTGWRFFKGADKALDVTDKTLDIVNAEKKVVRSVEAAEKALEANKSAEAVHECVDGSFSITEQGWSGYPEGLPKPDGPFRLLDGREYESARNAADKANRAIRSGDPHSLIGKELHEIHPVKFGGSPTDLLNKIDLTKDFHRKIVTPWWNKLLKKLTGG